MKFEGVYTPAITPYNDDGTIDEGAFVAILNHLIDSGVHAIIVGGSTGEYFTQTMEERIRMMRVARDTIGSRVPLVLGVSAIRTDDSVTYAKAAKDVAADALLLGSPPYASPSQEENALHALTVDRAANLPIMLYNYPDRMGVSMGTEYLDKVSRSQNVQAIKESSGDMNRVHLLVRDYPHIQLSCGMDDQPVETFAWGAQSWVCATANILPRECVWLYRACVLENNFVKGRRLAMAMLPLMRLYDQAGKFIQAIKHTLEQDGIRAGAFRGPVRPMDKDERRELETVIRTVRQTMAAIEAEV
jgi:4-hydroxy-tetrahydrodipicolinate synthase